MADAPLAKRANSPLVAKHLEGADTPPEDARFTGFVHVFDFWCYRVEGRHIEESHGYGRELICGMKRRGEELDTADSEPLHGGSRRSGKSSMGMGMGMGEAICEAEAEAEAGEESFSRKNHFSDADVFSPMSFHAVEIDCY